MNRLAFCLLVPFAVVISTHARAGLAEATDFPGAWTSGSVPYGGLGSSPDYWVAQATTSFDGVEAAAGRLDGIDAAQSWMQTTVAGPTTLYFSYKIDDFASVYPIEIAPGGFFVGVGSNPRLPLVVPPSFSSVTVDWTEQALIIPAGEQPVRWTLSFVKGSSPVRAYVDQVWTSDDPRPRITDTAKRMGQFGTASSWTVPVASSSAATLAVTGLPPGLTLDPDTHVIAGAPTAAGDFDATLVALNESGQHFARVWFDVSPGNTSLSEGVDAPALVFTQPDTSGAWTGATGIGHDGLDCARALSQYTIGPKSILSTTFEGPGDLSFWYRCADSRTNPGGGAQALLALFVGIPPSSQQPTAGLFETIWTKVTVPVPPGPQAVSWKAFYTRDVNSTEQRFVYLDELAFIPSAVPPQPTFAAWQTAWNVVGQPLLTDTDGDGLTLPMEYAFGGSPDLANRELLPVASVTNGYFTIEVPKAPSPTDLFCFIEASKDLAPDSWTTSTVDVIEQGGTHIRARSKKPISEQPILHLRVRVLIAP